MVKAVDFHVGNLVGTLSYFADEIHVKKFEQFDQRLQNMKTSPLRDVEDLRLDNRKKLDPSTSAEAIW